QIAIAQDLRSTLFVEADAARQSAQAANAPLLAPNGYTRGIEAYGNAEQDLARGRNLERIRNRLAQATRALNEAAEAAEIASITLASLSKTREDAVTAGAEPFSGPLWAEAEELFDASARRLESGDIRGARSRADEAETLYRDAEL